MFMTTKQHKGIAMILFFLILFSLFGSVVEATDVDHGTMFEVKTDKDGNVIMSGSGDTGDSSQRLIDRLRQVAGFVGAVALVIFVIVLIVLFVKLAATSNPAKRQEIQKQILVAFVAIGLTGAVATVVSVAYRFF